MKKLLLLSFMLLGSLMYGQEFDFGCAPPNRILVIEPGTYIQDPHYGRINSFFIFTPDGFDGHTVVDCNQFLYRGTTELGQQLFLGSSPSCPDVESDPFTSFTYNINYWTEDGRVVLRGFTAPASTDNLVLHQGLHSRLRRD